MAAVAGKVKSVTSDVIAIDKNDHIRVLNVNDEVYIGENYPDILDHMNEKVEDILTKIEVKEIESSANSQEIDENLSDKYNVSKDILTNSSELKADNSYEHANFDATTIYIEIDNDLNKLS